MIPLLPNGNSKQSFLEAFCDACDPPDPKLSQERSVLRPMPESVKTFIGHAIGWGIFLALLGLAIWSWGGIAAGFVLLICFTFPIIPAVIAVLLLICLVLSLWERNQRSIIRSELEKFHNKR